MKLTVRLFAWAKERAGQEVIELELENGASVSGAREEMLRVCPGLSSVLPSARIAVNRDYADEETILTDGDELAVIPPVSGG